MVTPHSQATVLKMPPVTRTPHEQAALRIAPRIWLIKSIKTRWYDEFMLHYPASFLPEPPLCWLPWERHSWESDYRTWRDAIKFMILVAREKLDD